MKHFIRVTSLSVILCAAAGDAAAQRHAFEGVAWQAPAESVRAALRARGFTFTATAGEGDLQFVRADSAQLQAELHAGRLVGITLIDPARGESVAERYRVVADSLRAALGPPDDTLDQRQEQLWVAGLSSIHLLVERVAGVRQVRIAWHGPGWYDEMDRRGGLPPQPEGYTTVAATHILRVAVDTTVRGGSADAALRGRFRIHYHQPVTLSPDGVSQQQMDAVEYEMDFDCAGRRARLVSRTTYLDGRRLGSDRPASQGWAVPQPDGHYDRGLDAVCRAFRG